jgi:hypothetical protein
MVINGSMPCNLNRTGMKIIMVDDGMRPPCWLQATFQAFDGCSYNGIQAHL